MPKRGEHGRGVKRKLGGADALPNEDRKRAFSGVHEEYQQPQTFAQASGGIHRARVLAAHFAYVDALDVIAQDIGRRNGAKQGRQ